MRQTEYYLIDIRHIKFNIYTKVIDKNTILQYIHVM